MRRRPVDSRQMELPLTTCEPTPELSFVSAELPASVSTPKLPSGRDSALEQLAKSHLTRLGFKEISELLVVIWNPRLGSTAGMCAPYDARITLNPRLSAISGAEVERTLLHELAHLVAQARHFGKRIQSHGRAWKKACADLGIPGEKSRHSLPLPRRLMQYKYLYQCPGCGYEARRTRPFRNKEACTGCCKKFNRGKYDSRFRLQLVKQAE